MDKKTDAKDVKKVPPGEVEKYYRQLRKLSGKIDKRIGKGNKLK